MSGLEKIVSDDFVSIDGQDTLAKLFRDRVGRWGDRVAMREKNFGIWDTYTWAEFDEQARNAAGGLIARGMQRGDVVAVLSDNNKEWLFLDMGTHIAGGVLNGVYPTYQAAQLVHLLVDSDTRYLIVENDEQLDKYLEVRDELQRVEMVYVIDWKGLRGFHDPKVRPIAELFDLGAKWRRENPDLLDKMIDAGANSDVCVLIYTSGTTGAPKGARISNRYLLFQMTAVPDPYQVSADDDMLTYLPLCHGAERVVSLCMGLATGARLNFAESPETVFQNIQELSPTVIMGVPRIWEKFYSRVSTLMSEATWIGRKFYGWAMKVGRERADRLIEGRPVPPMLDLKFRLADRFVFRSIKEFLGLDRAQFMLSGAAPISPDLLKWFLAMGLPVSEIYGQTETGIATVSNSNPPQPGTIGRPIPGVDVKLGAKDEIVVRSPGMFSGYINNPSATSATLVDGWVHTGDVGSVDEDNVWRITDRLKDIIITAGGKNITPSQIENALKFSPYVSDAIVVGDKRKYLTCLIMIDRENVENYAQAHAIPFTDYKSLCARPEVVALIDRLVTEVNGKFSSVEQIKKFRLIDILLTAEDDEVTPTMKLKRSLVEKKYAGLISQMY